MIYFIYILIILLVTDCNFTDNYISEGYYNTVVAEVPLDTVKFFNRVPDNPSVKYLVSKEPFIPYKVTYMFSTNPKSFKFKSDSLEIRYLRKYDYGDTQNPEFCHISIKRIKDKAMAFVIYWQNQKYNKRNFNSDDIGNNTDSLFSTLTSSMIKKLFPSFKGIYKQVTIDTIFLNPNYEEFTPLKNQENYFDNIQFKGLREG